MPPLPTEPHQGIPLKGEGGKPEPSCTGCDASLLCVWIVVVFLLLLEGAAFMAEVVLEGYWLKIFTQIFTMTGFSRKSASAKDSISATSIDFSGECIFDSASEFTDSGSDWTGWPLESGLFSSLVP